jgi:hypothetical protein
LASDLAHIWRDDFNCHAVDLSWVVHVGLDRLVTTAPTTPQVEAILWRYMGNAQKKGGLPGRITLDAKWYLGNELVAYGRKPPTTTLRSFRASMRATCW